MCEKSVYRAVCRGELRRVAPRVFAIAGTVDSWEQRVTSALLSTDGALSHFSAVRLWGFGFGSEGSKVEVTVGTAHRSTAVHATVHRTRCFGRHVTRHNNMRVMTVERTLIDLTAVCSERRVGAYLDNAVSKKLTTVRKVLNCLAKLTTVGRHRVKMMRRILASRSGLTGKEESNLEIRVLREIEKAGLSKPALQSAVMTKATTYILDAAYMKKKIDIEIDGPHHWRPTVSMADRRRDAELSLLGWKIIRIHCEMKPTEYIPLIRRALAA